MRKIFYILISLVCLTATAQTGLGPMQKALGHVKGDDIQNSDVAIGTAGTYKVGAILPAEKLKAYAGCDIVGIRFALGMDMARSAVTLNTINLASGGVSDAIISQTVRYPSQGWNNIFFTGGQKYRINGEESMLFSFEYTESETMVANKQGALCISGSNDSNYGFYLYGNFGKGEGWYSSTTGNLCIQLIVDASSMDPADVAFTMLTTGFKYKKAGDEIDFFAMYDNTGRDAISTAHLSALIDGEVVGTFEQTGVSDTDNSVNYIVKVPESLPIGQHSFTLRMDDVNGIPLAQERTISENFLVYSQSYKRQQHYLEQYMSQKSLYNQYTDAIMEDVLTASNACLVNMYNSASSLGIDASEPYITRYAYDFPCFTLDRFYFPGEAYVAYDVNQYASVVPEIMSGVISQMVAEQDVFPAFATINIDCQYDMVEAALDINVSGDIIEGASQLFGDNAVLTLMLTENNVKASQSVTNPVTQRTKTDTNYIHNHVLRSFLSAPEGDSIDLSANTYAMHYSIPIDDLWKVEDLELVAIISKSVDAPLTKVNANDFDVNNANSLAVKNVLDGIREVPNELPSKASSACYNALGQRLNSPSGHHGIVIVDGKKFFSK